MISAASLTVDWRIYHFLRKSGLGERPTILMVLPEATGWGHNQIFTIHTLMLHLGAFTATIMIANMFITIMPTQRIVVDDLKSGRTPDPKNGKFARLHSPRNNYLTLPVVFLMLSNHYPPAFATAYSWVIAALVSGWASLSGMTSTRACLRREPDLDLGRHCHFVHRRYIGIGGHLVGSKRYLAGNRRRYCPKCQTNHLQAGVTHAMPLVDVTKLGPEDCAAIIRWFQNAGS